MPNGSTRSDEQAETRSQIMALLEMGDNAGKGVYHLSSLRLSADGALSFLAEQVAKRPQIQELHMDECGLRIGNLPEVLKVLDAAPNLRKVSYQKNMLDVKSAKVLFDGIKKHPTLSEVDISNNCMENGGGKVVADFIASNPRLQVIAADKCNLLDEGMEPISRAIAANTAALRGVSFSNNKMTSEGMHGFARATMRENRRLTQVHCDNSPETNETLEKTFLYAPSPNVLMVAPVEGQEAKAVLNRNDAGIKHAVMLLQEGIEKQVPRRLQFLEDRKPAIFTSGLLRIGVRPPEEVKAEYETFMEALPKVPEAGAGFADGLFTPDANGFAPLDNPRAWQGTNPLEAIADIPLTREFLDRKTPKGTSLLDSLASHVSGEALVSHLNGKGIKLGLADLQEEKYSRPNRLMETLIEKGDAAALFHESNLIGKKRPEVLALHELLPAAQRAEIGIMGILSRLPKQTSTLGR